MFSRENQFIAAGRKHGKIQRLNAVSQILRQPDAELRLAALRTGIHNLSLLDRMVVALHFGARLSQHEIGLALTIPPATISHRLQRSVDDLRSELAQNGIYDELDYATLGDAVCSGMPAPRGLFEKVQSRVSAARTSMRATCGSMLRDTIRSVGKITLFRSGQ